MAADNHIAGPFVSKVRRQEGGGDKVLAEANDAVAELMASYPVWVMDDIARMEGHLAEAGADTEGRSAHLDRLHGAAHDIKGQGASFGYELMTKIGESLCDFIRADGGGDNGLRVMAAHIRAMKTVIDKRVSGDGGASGEKLVAGLAALAGASTN